MNNNKNIKDLLNNKKFFLIGGALLLMVIFDSYGIVGPGTMGILVTLGKVSPVALQPGVYFKLPLVSSIIPMSVRVNKFEMDETAASNDLQDVHTRIAVNFHVDPRDVSWVYSRVGTENQMSRSILSPVLSNTFKAVVAKYTAEELITKRNLVKSEIDSRLAKSLLAYKTVVDGVNITNFSFSPEFERAIERKQVAQQHALQAQYELDRARVKAQQKVVTAKADADAMKLKQAVLTPMLLRLEAIKRWNGVLPLVTGNGGIPLIDLQKLSQKKQ